MTAEDGARAVAQLPGGRHDSTNFNQTNNLLKIYAYLAFSVSGKNGALLHAVKNADTFLRKNFKFSGVHPLLSPGIIFA